MPQNHIMCWGFERFQIGDAVRLRLCEKEITTQVAVTRCKIISKVWMPAGHLCLKQDSLRRSSDLKIDTARRSVFILSRYLFIEDCRFLFISVFNDAASASSSTINSGLPFIKPVDANTFAHNRRMRLFFLSTIIAGFINEFWINSPESFSPQIQYPDRSFCTRSSVCC